MEKAILYVHGKGGDANEANYYKKLCSDADIIGIDYNDYTPWVVKEIIKNEYYKIAGKYKEISLITNSIGTYFAMLALQDERIHKAFFISPILNMERLITSMMKMAGVSEDELKEKGEIPTNFGETLSWKYLCFVRDNPINWCAPTAILYGERDNFTPYETVSEFAQKHHAHLTVMKDGEHWFHTKDELLFLDEWLGSEL